MIREKYPLAYGKYTLVQQTNGFQLVQRAADNTFSLCA